MYTKWICHLDIGMFAMIVSYWAIIMQILIATDLFICNFIRFPMGKYRKVREAFQTKVGSLTEEERRRVHCGKLIGLIFNHQYKV